MEPMNYSKNSMSYCSTKYAMTDDSKNMFCPQPPPPRFS